MHVRQALKFYCSLERPLDAVVRRSVIGTLHVRLEAVAVAPAADHHELARIAVGLPDLKVEETIVALHVMSTRAECGDELRCSISRDLKR